LGGTAYFIKEIIISKFGQDAFDRAEEIYTKLYDAFINKTLGGTVIYAEKPH
jgi:hypothetical protein